MVKKSAESGVPRVDTRAVHAGPDPETQAGFVNPPLYRGSTIRFPTVESYQEAGRHRLSHDVIAYARYGTPTSRALELAHRLQKALTTYSSRSAAAGATRAIR